MPDMCDYINCALKNIYKRCSMYEFNIEIWGNFFNFCIARRKIIHTFVFGSSVRAATGSYIFIN